MSRVMQIRRSTATFIIVIAAMSGALAYSWTSARHVPIFVSTAQAASTEAFQTGSFAPVVQRAMPAVVNISTTSKVKTQENPLGQDGGPFDDFFRQFFGGRGPQQQPRERVAHALGSGVVVSPDGYILTNNHVVEGATDIKVSFANQKEIPAKVIGTDAASDLAVIKVEQTNLPTLALGNSAGSQVGDVVLAIGNPFGLGQTVTMGIVSAKGRSGLGIEAVEDFIQTDAAINPGNSGGALINTRGELIGINTAIVGGQGGNVGIGFAIPANMARNVMDQLIKNGKVTRGFIGILPNSITPGQEEAFGLKPGQKGVAISQVDPNSPGAKAGLQVGDVIVAVNGNLVQDENSFRLQVAGMAPGSRVELRISRSAAEQTVPVVLGENTQYAKIQRGGRNGQGPGGDQGGEASALAGVQVDSISPELQQKLNLPARMTGVVVTDVAEGSAAGEAGLQEGDVISLVNHRKVTNPSDFDAAVKTSNQVLVLVYRNGASRFVVIPNKQ